MTHGKHFICGLGMFSPKPQEDGWKEQEMAKGVNVAEGSSEVVAEASLDLATWVITATPRMAVAQRRAWRGRTREEEAWAGLTQPSPSSLRPHA